MLVIMLSNIFKLAALESFLCMGICFVVFFQLVIIFLMSHELAREAMFIADELEMNRGDYAFILVLISINDILLSNRYPFFILSHGRYTQKLTEGARKSFENALTISFDLKPNNMISDPAIIKTVANLTTAPPFNRLKNESEMFRVRNNEIKEEYKVRRKEEREGEIKKE